MGSNPRSWADPLGLRQCGATGLPGAVGGGGGSGGGGNGGGWGGLLGDLGGGGGGGNGNGGGGSPYAACGGDVTDVATAGTFTCLFNCIRWWGCMERNAAAGNYTPGYSIFGAAVANCLGYCHGIYADQAIGLPHIPDDLIVTLPWWAKGGRVAVLDPGKAQTVVLLIADGYLIVVPIPLAKAGLIGKIFKVVDKVDDAVNVVQNPIGAITGKVGGKAVGKAGKRGGETAATRRGRQVHKDFADKVDSKPGWRSEVRVKDPTTGRPGKVDAITPSGHPIELKPNTPSGRRRGASQIKKYERATQKRGRVVYYEVP